jgi:hypothetical protein
MYIQGACVTAEAWKILTQSLPDLHDWAAMIFPLIFWVAAWGNKELSFGGCKSRADPF